MKPSILTSMETSQGRPWGENQNRAESDYPKLPYSREQRKVESGGEFASLTSWSTTETSGMVVYS